MPWDPRNSSFLAVPALICVAGLAVLLFSSGPITIEAEGNEPDLAYVDSIPAADAAGDEGSEENAEEGGLDVEVSDPGGTSGTDDGANDRPVEEPTPAGPSVSSPTTTAPATAPPTSGPSSGEPSTTGPSTTTPPTTAAPVTQAPTTTTAPTSAAPTTTTPPTTAAPTTQAPTTQAPTTAPPAAAGIAGVLIEGESTSDPNDGWNTYPSNVADNLGSDIAVQIDGRNGVRIDDVNAEGSKAHLLSGNDGHNVAVLWIGINDISQAKEPSDIYSQINSWSNARRAEGWDKVVLLTVTKFEHENSVKDYFWGSHEIADQKRQELNQLIVSNSMGADAIVDLRNVEGIGDSFSIHDTNWRPDKVHLTPAGNAKVAEAVSTAIASLG